MKTLYDFIETSESNDTIICMLSNGETATINLQSVLEYLRNKGYNPVKVRLLELWVLENAENTNIGFTLDSYVQLEPSALGDVPEAMRRFPTENQLGEGDLHDDFKALWHHLGATQLCYLMVSANSIIKVDQYFIRSFFHNARQMVESNDDVIGMPMKWLAKFAEPDDMDKYYLY